MPKDNLSSKEITKLLDRILCYAEAKDRSNCISVEDMVKLLENSYEGDKNLLLKHIYSLCPSCEKEMLIIKWIKEYSSGKKVEFRPIVTHKQLFKIYERLEGMVKGEYEFFTNWKILEKITVD